MSSFRELRQSFDRTYDKIRDFLPPDGWALVFASLIALVFMSFVYIAISSFIAVPHIVMALGLTVNLSVPPPWGLLEQIVFGILGMLVSGIIMGFLVGLMTDLLRGVAAGVISGFVFGVITFFACSFIWQLLTALPTGAIALVIFYNLFITRNKHKGASWLGSNSRITEY